MGGFVASAPYQLRQFIGQTLWQTASVAFALHAVAMDKSKTANVSSVL